MGEGRGGRRGRVKMEKADGRNEKKERTKYKGAK